MKKFAADRIYALGTALGHLGGMLETLDPKKKTSPITSAERSQLLGYLPSFIEDSNDIGLPTAPIPLVALKEKLSRAEAAVTYEYVDRQIQTFKDRVKDELSLHSFYQIRSDRIKYYDGAPALFGAEVVTAFPSSLDDVEEAGKCLAVGRSTACVFHLMRSLSPVIKAIAAEISFKPNENWGPFLNDFRNEIWKKFPDDKTKSNEDQRLFYSDLEQQLRAIKDAWRNPTMHSIAAVYTEDKAEEIFGYVKGLMKKAAEKLKEQP